jgi:O-antigen/teichoic acid export membrane protein
VPRRRIFGGTARRLHLHATRERKRSRALTIESQAVWLAAWLATTSAASRSALIREPISDRVTYVVRKFFREMKAMRDRPKTDSTKSFAIRNAFGDSRAPHTASAIRQALLIAYKAVADLAGKGSFFVITVLAARRLSRYDFGLFSLATTLGWMLSVAADFGIQLHLARAVAIDPNAAERLLMRWLRVRIATAALSIAGVAVWVAFNGWNGEGLSMVLLAAVYACSALVEFLHYFYRGLSRSEVESSLILWQRLATLGGAVAVLVWRPDLTWLAWALLVPVLVTFLASLRIARHLARSARRGADGTDGAAVAESTAIEQLQLLERLTSTAAEFRKDVAPIGLGILLSALYFRIDVFLLQLWSGTTQVALYNAVFRLVEALRLFPAAVLAVTLPSLVTARDRRPLTRVSLAVTSFALVCTVVLWIAAPWMVPLLYGEDYAAAVPTFRILTLSFPLLSLNYALTHQLIGWAGERIYAVICAAALIVNVALNARLIPSMSIAGAAWATLGTELFLTASCLTALRLMIGRRALPTQPASAAL